MKSVLIITVLGLSCLALVSGLDRGFKPPVSNSTLTTDEKFKKIKTAANFGKTGAKIEVCPSGDCTQGQVISLVLSRLEELNMAGTVISRAANLSTSDGQWSELTARDFDGVAAMTTTYNATLVVVKDNSTTLAVPTFSMTAAIYSTNGTAENGNQTVAVPAGGLKFTVSLENWPFQDQTNSLRFAVAMKARGKGETLKELAKTQKQKKPQLSSDGTKDEKIDRLDFGEGMFRDVLSIAVLNGVSTDIKASADASGASAEYAWEFPPFKKTLYYDPVLGSTDATATTTATTTTETPTPTPPKSSALPLTLTGVAATTVAALALVFF